MSNVLKSSKEILESAKRASPILASASEEQKNKALSLIADKLIACSEEILSENEIDLKNAEALLTPVMLDRLRLNPSRIQAMAEGARELISLPDPVFKVLSRIERPNGLLIEKLSVPFGVVGVIYESRPNVTMDACCLALKSGNAVVLRGGKESFHSNKAIVNAIHEGLREAGMPEEIVGLIEDLSRQSAREMMEAKGYIDLLIPRGGKGLIQSCVEHAKVPCIETGTGICHLYIDDTADLDMALNIIENAKTSRPSVCNAAEVLVVSEYVAEKLLPALKKRLCDDREEAGLVPVELRLDENALKIIPGTPAGEDDFDTEFLDYILSVRVVKNIDEAITHIGSHSTGHSDCIITRDSDNADKFVRQVDSAAVYVNASTRFTDGGEFGLGCEMGISTQKLHARGPMGLQELNTYKYIIRGNGQVR